MFILGFNKTAAAYATLSPEEIAEEVSEKYPYKGAVHGAAAGAAAGAARALAKGRRVSPHALAGVAAGGAAGAVLGHGRKEWEKYKTRRLMREVGEYNLRSTPRRQQMSHGE